MRGVGHKKGHFGGESVLFIHDRMWAEDIIRDRKRKKGWGIFAYAMAIAGILLGIGIAATQWFPLIKNH